MTWLIITAILVLVVVIALIRKTLSSHPDEFPYIKKDALFSPAERSLYGVLEQAVGTDYRIFGKIRVADLVEVKRNPKHGAWQSAFNKISSKHFDFVLCTNDDLRPLLAIELNDKSHQQRSRQERDSFLAGVCNEIGLPLIQLQAKQAYSVIDIREKITGTLGKGSAAVPEFESNLISDNAASLSQAEVGSDVLNDAAPSCPKCNSTMVQRRANSGPNAGEEFWGCSKYPRCRGVLPVGSERAKSSMGAL
jgi:hypothetical protein